MLDPATHIGCSFGLSYTTFELSDLKISELTSNSVDIIVEVKVTVKNTGVVTGSEVVQIYVTYPDIGLVNPNIQLKGFAKAHDLASGESKELVVRLDKYAISYWDERRNTWFAKAGKYDIFAGQSSDSLALRQSFDLGQSFSWSGL